MVNESKSHCKIKTKYFCQSTFKNFCKVIATILIFPFVSKAPNKPVFATITKGIFRKIDLMLASLETNFSSCVTEPLDLNLIS